MAEITIYSLARRLVAAKRDNERLRLLLGDLVRVTDPNDRQWDSSRDEIVRSVRADAIFELLTQSETKE